MKLLSAGALDAADLKDAAGAVATELGVLEDKYVGDLLTKRREEVSAIDAFQGALKALPSLLSKGDGSEARPLVIIVDELDRCRPSFALQILERVKHFFSVPSVHFLFGVHLVQLRNSIKVAYGADINAQLYLQKFINLTLHLVDDAIRYDDRVATKYIQYLFGAMQIPQDQAALFAVPYFRHLAEGRGLSLRSIEQIVSTYAIAQAFKDTTQYCPIYVLVGLCALKVVSPELYIRAKAGTITFDDLRVALGFADPMEQRDRLSLQSIRDAWQFFCGPEAPADSKLRRFGTELHMWSLGREDVIPFIANNIVDRLARS